MPLKNKNKGAGSAPIGGKQLRGKISYFGGPNDGSTKGAGGVEKSTASGAPTSVPGIAVYDQSTLKGYWKVTTPNGRTQIIQQTDIGPAPWTGRLIDFTYSALHLFGYTEGNFPTNGVATAVYLGKDKQAAVEKGGNAVEAAQAITSGGEVAPGAGSAGGRQNASLKGDIEGAGSLLEVLSDLLTGNLGDLGGKVALAGLNVSKGLALGFADLIVAPAWHWNQRSTAYYSAYILSPRNIGNGTQFQWAFAWNAAFWGVGYALLFTEKESASLKPAPAHRSRLAHHVRKAQALPARKSLVKPGDVKAHTPKKPKPAVSKATVTLQSTLSTTRARQVKVHGTSTGAGVNGDGHGTTSSVPITPDPQTTAATSGATQPHASDQRGSGAHRPKRGDSPHSPAQGAGARDRT